MLKYLITYLGAGAAIAVLDFTWLTLATPRVYRPTLNDVLADKPDLKAAVIFYLAYLLGVLMLAILPNRDGGIGRVALAGAMLGAMAYATYDLTNQATLKVWSTRISVIDISWGTFLTATGATAGLLAWRWASKTFP